MGISLKLVLWKKDKDMKGKCPIAISISGGGKRTYYNTGIKVEEHYWNSWRSGEKIPKEAEDWGKDSIKLMQILSSTQIEIAKRDFIGKDTTLDDVKYILNPDKKESINFIDFYKDHLDYIRSRSSSGYYRHYKVEYNEFVNFAGDKLPFSGVTASFIEKYEASLHGRKKTTINSKMKKLNQIINKAIERELISKKQVAGYKIPGYKKPERNYLTLEQLNKIEEWVYDDEFKNDPEMQKVCCYFLIECHSAIRFSDWKNFRVEKLINENNFKVRTKKNDEPVYLSLDVFTSLAKIVYFVKQHHIVFNLTEQATNRILKDLERKFKNTECPLPFEKLTTHVGRHTFGTMLGEKGYSTARIAEAMGISELTAKVYVHQTRKGFSEESKRLGAW